MKNKGIIAFTLIPCGISIYSFFIRGGERQSLRRRSYGSNITWEETDY